MRLLALSLIAMARLLPRRSARTWHPPDPTPAGHETPPDVVPQVALVRPYVLAEELRREQQAWQQLCADLAEWSGSEPPVDPEPGSGPGPAPELPRRTPGEHAPLPSDPGRPAPAASPEPPSAQTLQHVLEGLQGLQGRDIATAEPAENEKAPTMPLVVVQP